VKRLDSPSSTRSYEDHSVLGFTKLAQHIIKFHSPSIFLILHIWHSKAHRMAIMRAKIRRCKSTKSSVKAVSSTFRVGPAN